MPGDSVQSCAPIAKKSAARWSRAKSTPKEEGGGDKGEGLMWPEAKSLRWEIMDLPRLRSSIFCALRHIFFAPVYVKRRLPYK
jgi:hypothetical protein